MRPRRILVIDDSVDFLKALEIRLQTEGFEVSTASSGQEGLEAIARQPFDLILLDMLMPEKDGVTIYQELRANPSTRATPTILLTGIAVEGYWEPMPYETDGISFIMGKPYDVKFLIARMHQVLAQTCGGS